MLCVSHVSRRLNGITVHRGGFPVALVESGIRSKTTKNANDKRQHALVRRFRSSDRETANEIGLPVWCGDVRVGTF